ncbi:MAG: hypothetical protein CMO80_22035 [Verrucomicrobiales bacterium]|nr:hypothetical protein [Verrucomicrobiales bacterium]|tara:strand:- start:8560 stop:10287 length:1728 start_codon:yes stop_codon:yes gene_type:complete
MKPRDYQEYAINSVFNYFAEGNTGNPVVCMPTGTGKSLVSAEFIRRVCTQWPGQRIILLTHVKELIEQNYDKLMQIWATAPAGIYSAGIGRKETMFNVTYAGIQSIHRVAHLFGHVDLIIVDECHLIPNKSNTMYRKFIDLLMRVNPNLKVIGLTATAFRVGTGMITDKDGFFDDICCDMCTLEAFNWFLTQGYLCELVPKSTEVQIDLTGVGTSQGDFKQGELQRATDREEITRAAIGETIAYAENENRKHWLIFGTGVDHVEHIVSELNEWGVTAVAVHSKMSTAQRDANIEAFMRGEVTALVNNGVLTTGFDAPFVDLLVILRATKSPGLWVQILGRGTRPFYAEGYDLSTQQGRLDAIAYSEKPNCLVLDFAGNTKRLGPINDPVIPKAKGKGGGEAPVRECDKCHTMFHASLRVCPTCGHEYPPEIKFKAGASSDALIAKKRKKKDDEPIVQTFKVDLLTYKIRKGRMGKPDYIEMTYQCGLRRFKQPLCLEHEGYALKMAKDWWREAARTDVPETLGEATERWHECETPKYLRVWTNRKPYPEIKRIDYTGELAGEVGIPNILKRGENE